MKALGLAVISIAAGACAGFAYMRMSRPAHPTCSCLYPYCEHTPEGQMWIAMVECDVMNTRYEMRKK